MAQWIKSNVNIDFVGRQRKFATFSALLVLGSIGVLIANVFIRGQMLNWGTEFKGGTQIEVQFAKAMKPLEVRATLTRSGYKGAEVVQVNDPDRPNLYVFRLSEVSSLSQGEQDKVRAALKQTFGVNLKDFEYAVGGDRVRLYFKRGFKVAPSAVVPLPASQPTAAASQPSTQAAASQPAASQPAASQPAVIVRKQVEGGPEPPAFERLRKLFTAAGVTVQNVVQPGRAEDNRYEVILGGLAEEMRKIFGPGVVKDVPQVESVGPKMGQQLRDDGIKSVVYALLLILVYIAFRFDFRFAPGAVVALAHDVILATGLFAVLWIEFSLPVLAAVLTIAGYSINDTIVIYDRIRENVARLRDRKFSLVVNASINETLGRTLITSLTTMFTSVAVYALSTGAVRNFALALTFGIIVGTYSTIFVASPFTVFLNEKWAKRAAKSR